MKVSDNDVNPKLYRAVEGRCGGVGFPTTQLPPNGPISAGEVYIGQVLF